MGLRARREVEEMDTDSVKTQPHFHGGGLKVIGFPEESLRKSTH